MTAMKRLRIKHMGCLTTILVIVTVKIIWVACMSGNHGSFETEKEEILQRRNYLADKVLVPPEALLEEMPKSIGPQFQGEWALYTCSMFSAALTNIARLYPDTRQESLRMIDSLIGIVLSPSLRKYDAERWKEDPLESQEGDHSHISYLSHLGWMIGGYKILGGGKKYDRLYHSLCRTMNRRILQSGSLNLQTYPDEPIYVPDMLVAIVALSNYSRLYKDRYATTVKRWIRRARKEWLDKETGLLASYLSVDGELFPGAPVKGSYSALNCYYLTFIDDRFAWEQYEKLLEVFRQDFLVTGIKERSEGFCLLGMDIDAGPIILRLSPTGTAFALGSVTYFEDFSLRNRLLKTAEVAGSTVKWGDKRHYLLADVALVGEAIVLAMRTATRWKQ